MKNALKKSISILLVAVMIFGTAPLAGFVGIDLPELNLFGTKAEAEEAPTSGTCGDNLTWTFDESTGELVISGTGLMTGWSFSSSVPWYNYKSKIKAVTIPDGVTSIGTYAFKDCDSLTSVTIPESVTSIGISAFAGCASLESVTIPDSVTSIGGFAFISCTSLESVTIGKGITRIGSYVFYNCTSLEGVTIPDSVTSIGDGVFFHCTSLASVTIPDSVTIIDASAFSYCESLENVTIPKSVTSIGDNAFLGCTNIKDVYYGGSRKEWERIPMGGSNQQLTSARIHYNSAWSDSDSTETPDNTPDYDSSVTDTYLVPTPTETKIIYGDSIVLHVDPSKIPEGGKAEWYPSNGNFSYSVSSDGTTCTITPDKKGDTTFIALIYDAEGNIVSADEQTMTSKAGFFDKIIAFFKKLFGLTKTIPEAIKIIY